MNAAELVRICEALETDPETHRLGADMSPSQQAVLILSAARQEHKDATGFLLISIGPGSDGQRLEMRGTVHPDEGLRVLEAVIDSFRAMAAHGAGHA